MSHVNIRPFIVGNLKMNPNNWASAIQLAKAIAEATTGAECDITLCPPFPFLEAVKNAVAGSHVQVGAQDVYWEPKGAFTGEVSVSMLEDFCRVVIIGHSERRQYFGETDGDVNKKLKAVLRSGIDPVICIGEKLEERQSGATELVLRRQLLGAFAGIELSPRITMAYEPVWAIGTGLAATPQEAQQACSFIRSILREFRGPVADEIRILYGGSVNPDNASALLSLRDVDGALVGGASLSADQFAAICAVA